MELIDERDKGYRLRDLVQALIKNNQCKNIQAFALSIGKASSCISVMMKGNRRITTATELMIKHTYPCVNLDYLQHGIPPILFEDKLIQPRGKKPQVKEHNSKEGISSLLINVQDDNLRKIFDLLFTEINAINARLLVLEEAKSIAEKERLVLIENKNSSVSSISDSTTIIKCLLSLLAEKYNISKEVQEMLEEK